MRNLFIAGKYADQAGIFEFVKNAVSIHYEFGMHMFVSEPIYPDENSELQCDCFKAAAKFIQQPRVMNGPDDYRLVHGNVATIQKVGVVNHAWVEEGDFVYELSIGQKRLFSKDDYYKSNQITDVRIYTVTEALKLVDVHGHWGPWD